MPPIIVHGRTRRVVDGIGRFRLAEPCQQVSGSGTSKSTVRIPVTCPYWSERLVGLVAGFSPRTAPDLRRSTADLAQSNKSRDETGAPVRLTGLLRGRWVVVRCSAPAPGRWNAFRALTDGRPDFPAHHAGAGRGHMGVRAVLTQARRPARGDIRRRVNEHSRTGLVNSSTVTWLDDSPSPISGGAV